MNSRLQPLMLILMLPLVSVLTSCNHGQRDASANNIQPAYDGPFPTIVNYDLSLGEMIKAGGYGDTDSDITPAHFPSNERGTIRVNVLVANFWGDTDSDVILQVFQKDGLRPATLRELLALASQYPRLEDDTTIIALGSTWKGRTGADNVTFLFRSNGTRKIELAWTGVFAGADYRFAAVRKEQ